MPYTLGEIVVAGQTKANEIALYNEVSAEKIAATNSKTAAEALRYATGVQVLQGAKNEPDVSIHGMGQEKVLVLIDGVPYYETNYGKLNLSQIPADIIAKIEVIKEPPPSSTDRTRRQASSTSSPKTPGSRSRWGATSSSARRTTTASRRRPGARRGLQILVQLHAQRDERMEDVRQLQGGRGDDF